MFSPGIALKPAVATRHSRCIARLDELCSTAMGRWSLHLVAAAILVLFAASGDAHAQAVRGTCCVAVAPGAPAAPMLRFDAIGPYDGVIAPRNRLATPPPLPGLPGALQGGMPDAAAALTGRGVAAPGVGMTYTTPMAGGSASVSFGIRTPEPAPGNRLSLIAPP